MCESVTKAQQVPSGTGGYHPCVAVFGLSIWRRICAVPVLVQDGWIYLASGVFGAITAAVAVSSDYRAWGQVAGCSYAGAAMICLIGERARKRPSGRGRNSDPVGTARR